eukprot:1386325-Pleurochrysis_carterae.AAC.1
MPTNSDGLLSESTASTCAVAARGRERCRSGNVAVADRAWRVPSGRQGCGGAKQGRGVRQVQVDQGRPEGEAEAIGRRERGKNGVQKT